MTLATRPATARLLTDTDRQVLQGLADGLTNQQIARRIGCNKDAVSSRLSRLYARLGVRNAPHAVAHVIRAGLLPSAPNQRTHPQ